MKIEAVAIQNIEFLPPIAYKDAKAISIFEDLGTNNCSLDCEAWKIRQSIAKLPATNKAEKRQKQSEKKAFFKKIIQQERQNRQNDEKIANTKLAANREPFTLKDLEISAKNGCSACRFIDQLLNALLSAYPNLDFKGSKLEWSGYEFLFKVQNQHDQTFSFQFFAPTGKYLVVNKIFVLYTNQNLLIRRCQYYHSKPEVRKCSAARHIQPSVLPGG